MLISVEDDSTTTEPSTEIGLPYRMKEYGYAEKGYMEKQDMAKTLLT